jgi:gas vesicle protein
MGEVLKIYKALEEKLGGENAKIVAEAIESLIEHKTYEAKTKLKEELVKELATKYDLQLTEQSLRALIEQCRGELQAQIEQVRGELKAEIEQVRGELKAEIEQVRGELKAEIKLVRVEIQNVKNELLKWMIALFIGQATFIVGLVFTLVKLLKG